MILDKDNTSIHVEECVDHDYRIWQAGAPVQVRYWTASLSGVSTSGHEVSMSREGGSPDDALKNLFEAMGDADVTL